MRLFEHSDYQAAITAAATARGRSEAVIEKDYFITEALRVVANEFDSGQVIFKGGTSLSKGWRLISRLSEDIDLLVVRESFSPSLGKGGVDRELKRLRDAISEHDAFEHLSSPSSSRGFSRSDVFGYPAKNFDDSLLPRVLVEPGVRGGTLPVETLKIQSEVGEYLTESGAADFADDLDSFEIPVLHFKRTFVEKLFAVHSLAMRYLEEGTPFGRDARHYLDLVVLGRHPTVLEMLANDEYAEIKRDQDEIARTYFPEKYVPPEGLSFKTSPAMSPTGDLREEITGAYLKQGQDLSFGEFPSFDEVLEVFESIRDRL